MIRKTLLALLLLATVAGAWAQDERPYKPLIREGCKWYYQYFTDGELCPEDYELCGSLAFEFYELYFDGDTIISGIAYKKLHARYQFMNKPEQDKVAAYMREENKRVYVVGAQEKVLDLEVQSYEFRGDVAKGPYYDLTGEVVAYDFADPIGLLSGTWGGNRDNMSVTQVTTLQGETRDEFTYLESDSNDPTLYPAKTIIEGIGAVRIARGGSFINPNYGPVWHRCNCPETGQFSHFVNENGEVEYALWRPYCYLLYDEFDQNDLVGCYSNDLYERYLRTKLTSSTERVTLQGNEVVISSAAGQILIARPAGRDQGAVNIYDLSGKPVKSLPVSQSNVAISTRDLPSGVYIVQYIDPVGRVNRKLEVNR